MEWISVKNKNPDEDYCFYLATIKSPSNTWVEIVGFAGGHWHLPCRGETEFVTHWANIPAPASL